MSQAGSASTTRRALFAGAALAVAAISGLSAAPDAEAETWLRDFLGSGGRMTFTDIGGGEFVVGVWAPIGGDERAHEMHRAMTAGNPLRPRIVSVAKAMHRGGLI